MTVALVAVAGEAVATAPCQRPGGHPEHSDDHTLAERGTQDELLAAGGFFAGS